MTGQETHVTAPEGTTPREIVARLGLDDYQLARVADRRVLPQDQDVTRSVQSGERLFAFAPMVVGGGLAELLYTIFLGAPPGGAPGGVTDAGTAGPPVPESPLPPSTVAVPPDPASTIAPAPWAGEIGARPEAAQGVVVLQDPRARPAIPYWRLRGWRQVKSNLYLGYFKTRLGRRHGVIKWTSQYDFGFYVHDVPNAILEGPHGGCFQEVKPGKFRVHFAQMPEDMNSAIFYLETVLQEAFEHGQIA
jgi:hypothetical protein